jgi:hypothetical protein
LKLKTSDALVLVHPDYCGSFPTETLQRFEIATDYSRSLNIPVFALFSYQKLHLPIQTENWIMLPCTDVGCNTKDLVAQIQLFEDRLGKNASQIKLAVGGIYSQRQKLIVVFWLILTLTI